MTVGAIPRSRQKLPTVAEFKGNADYAPAKKPRFSNADTRTTLLDSICDELGKVRLASKLVIVDYLGGLATLATVCQRYLDSQGNLKILKMKLGGNSRSITAVENLRAAALQRKQDIVDKISEYDQQIRDQNAGGQRPLGGSHDQRLAMGKGLDPSELRERVIEDVRQTHAVHGMAAASPARLIQRQKIAEEAGTQHNNVLSENLTAGGFWQLRHMLKHYPNLLQGPVGDPVPQLDYLRTQAERDPYRITFDTTGGPTMLLDHQAANFNTAATGWTYAVDNTSGEFYSKPGTRDLSHHSTFFAGMPVMCAGDIRIDNGRLSWITNTSGHYRPTKEHLYDALLFLRDEWQVDLTNVGALIMEGNEMNGSFAVCPATYLLAHNADPGDHHAHPNLGAAQDYLMANY